MKRTAIVGLVGVLAVSIAGAEPVFLPQAASVLKQKQIEAGVDGMFGYQISELTGGAGTTFKDRVWAVPLWGRYGILDTLESHLSVPIVRAVDSSEGTSSSRSADTGLGNIQIGAKWNFLSVPLPLAVALDLDLPTANPANNPGSLGQRYTGQLQQGFNAHLQMVADTPSYGPVKGHAMVGYMNTATYSTTAQTRFNPSDLATYGAGVDLSLGQWVNALSVSGEFVGYSAINHSKTNGVKNGNDKGTVLEAGPAMRYQVGKVKLHAGVLYDAGKATFRAYNYRVDFGASVLFGAN